MRLVVLIALVASLTCAAAQELKPDKWVDWQPFLGTWEGEGGGGPGQGSGTFTFIPELQGAVLVRHNYSQYPATKDKPAYRHDDLMIIYPDPSSKKTRADYWDNEGHVIHYAVEFTDGARKVVMVSEAGQPGPRYRLTYLKTGDNDLKLAFEIAPPDAPDKFKTYVEASAKRTKK
jgi:hypothetical protein